jgi:hypothetical protein
MQEQLGFLRVSSVVVKIAAWFFLFLGIIGGASLIIGLAPNSPRWMGVIILAVYTLLFLFFYLIARMADLLSQIIKEIKK